MVKKIKLHAYPREKTGRRSKEVRQKGMIPAVMYGGDIENQNLEFKYDEFQKVYSQAGESSLVDLEVEKADPVKAIIKDIQRDHVKGDIIHADLYKVDMKQKLEVEVPLNFINESDSPAVREKGGMIVKALDSIYIRCLPGDLPEHVDIDLAQVKDFDDAIRIKDLNLGDDIEIQHDPEDYIAGAEEIREEEEEEPVAEEAAEGEEAKEGDAEAEEGKDQEEAKE